MAHEPQGRERGARAADTAGETPATAASGGVGPVRLADGLGVASALLGAPMLFSTPRLLAAAGIRADGKARAMCVAVGVREFAATATILAMRHRRVGMWSRVGGDTIDLALLAAAYRTRRKDTARLAGAIAFIATIFAIDLFTARKLNQAEGVGVVDGSGSFGVGAPRDPGGGPARIRTAVTILASEEEVRAELKDFARAGDRDFLDACERARIVSAPGDRGTEVHIDHEPTMRGGRLAVGALKLLGRSPDQKINDELRRFKALTETRVAVRSDKTPQSFSSRYQILQRPAQPPAQRVDGAAAPAAGGRS